MIALDGKSLTLEKYREVVLGGEKVELHPSARDRILKSRKIVDKASLSDEKVYSINTGFGILSKIKIDADCLEELSLNLIRSHSCGVGDPHSEAESRGMVLLRANALATGFCGVRPETAELLLSLLNHRVHPVIPSKGSVGSSGDLAPLAHLACVLVGEGEAFFEGKRMSGGEALKKAGLKPVRLGSKEGLSLINGTQQMTAVGALTLLQAEELAKLADLICTATLEGTLGSPRAYSAWVQDTRPFPGQKESAARLFALMQDSEIYDSHENCDRVQDPYSIRCAPQVHGACLDLLRHVRNTLSIELNAATDNPLVNWETGEIVSNGNFHGQPIAFALDILGMAISELGSISERRTVKLMNPVFSELPTFLVVNEGLHSGLMITQYTAAALVCENRLLTHPGSTDSLPTNNEKEDHNSMGPNCARKAKTILENTIHILAIEALAACQALEFRKPLKPAIGPRFLYEVVRERVAPLEKDRVLSGDMAAVADLIRSGELYQRAVTKGVL